MGMNGIKNISCGEADGSINACVIGFCYYEHVKFRFYPFIDGVQYICAVSRRGFQIMLLNVKRF